MCKHCRATGRLARRAARLSCPTRQATNRPLSDETLARVLSIVDEKSDKLVSEAARISAETGMRMREISALKWSDIDFENKRIAVRSQKSHRNRVISISERLAEGLKASSTAGPEARILPRGRQWLSSAVNRALRSACEHLNFQPITVTSLRHSFASRAVAAGVPFSVLLRIMGYKPRR